MMNSLIFKLSIPSVLCWHWNMELNYALSDHCELIISAFGSELANTPNINRIIIYTSITCLCYTGWGDGGLMPANEICLNERIAFKVYDLGKLMVSRLIKIKNQLDVNDWIYSGHSD